MFFDILAVVLSFSFMVFIHEFGHLISAKHFGLTVKEFALGFGPKICSKAWRGTEYSIRCVPLGGFNDIEIDPGKDGEGEFYSLPLWKRVVILAAGSAFNLISALVIIYFILTVYGAPSPTSSVAKVHESTPAYGILMDGDKLLSVNGVDKDVYAMSDEITKSQKLEIKVLRNEDEKVIHIDKGESAKIGITFALEKMPLGVFEAVPRSCQVFERVSMLIFKGFQMIFTGEVKMTEAVSGPVGISQQIYKMSAEMGLEGVLMLTALISVNLGIMNLFPIPCLDGGHIAMQSLETLLKKKFSEQQIKYIQYVGIALIGLLFLVGLYADVLRILKT